MSLCRQRKRKREKKRERRCLFPAERLDLFFNFVGFSQSREDGPGSSRGAAAWRRSHGVGGSKSEQNEQRARERGGERERERERRRERGCKKKGARCRHAASRNSLFCKVAFRAPLLLLLCRFSQVLRLAQQRCIAKTKGSFRADDTPGERG